MMRCAELPSILAAKRLPMKPFLYPLLAGWFTVSGFCLSADSSGQSLVPDSSFGNAGLVMTNISPASEFLRCFLLQPDGKMVAGGSAYNTTSQDIALIRYLPDGTPDISFGMNGITLSGSPVFGETVNCLVQLADGRILAAGSADTSGHTDMMICRFMPAGELDTSFGNGGCSIIPRVNSMEYTQALLLQADGKILLGGYTVDLNSSDNILVRLMPDGLPDTSFDGDGIRISGAISEDEKVQQLFQRPSGEIVVLTQVANSLGGRMELIQLMSDGSPDPGFGSNGLVVPDIANEEEGSTGMLLQPDGRLLLCGYVSGASSAADFFIMRFTSSGQPDNTFGTGGYTITTLLSNLHRLTQMLLLPDGRILVGGHGRGVDFDFMLMRYSTAGQLDTSLGNAGMVLTNFGQSEDFFGGMALQPDGKIIQAGYSSAYGFSLIRFKPQAANTGLVSLPGDLPVSCYPNPSAGISFLRLSLDQPGYVSVSLNDINGRRIAAVYDRVWLDAGAQELPFMLPDLAPGLYAIQVTAGGRQTSLPWLRQ